MDAVLCVALAHQSAEDELCRSEKLSIEAGALRMAWLRKVLHWDLTPILVTFGILGDMVRPVAKYFWRYTGTESGSEGQRWVKLSFEEYQARGMSKVPEKGSLELAAQDQYIDLAYYDDDVSHGDPYLRTLHPCIGPRFTGEEPQS